MVYKISNKESINKALEKLSSGDTLILEPGIYEEKVIVRNENITIKGEDRDKTIITNHDFYLKTMSDHNECNTFRTYTLAVLGNNVQMLNLTIENSSVPSSKYGQAVALYTAGDMFYGFNLKIVGNQDTLFTGPLPKDLQERYIDFLPEEFRLSKNSRQQFVNCDIYGDVDFIFGGATVIFDHCNIYCLNERGYVAAPSHDKSVKLGYLFKECHIIGVSDKPYEYYYLARPWREYGFVAYVDCKYDIRLSEERFDRWNDTDRHKTCRFYEYNTNVSGVLPFFAKELTLNEKDELLKEYERCFGEKKC